MVGMPAFDQSVESVILDLPPLVTEADSPLRQLNGKEETQTLCGSCGSSLLGRVVADQSNRSRFDRVMGLSRARRSFLSAPKLTLCETSPRSEDRLQNYPAVRDERHEETQHAA
jgi:hypothetical protein